MVVYDDTSNEPVRIFDSGAKIPDPETFGEYQLSYRTGDIVSPRIEATEPLSLELADFAKSILEGTPPVVVRSGRSRRRAHDRGRRPLACAEGGIPVRVERDGSTLFPRAFMLRSTPCEPGDVGYGHETLSTSGRVSRDRHPRRRAGRTDRGVHPRSSWTTWSGVRGGRHGRGHRQDDRVQRLPLRSWRSQVLHQAPARPEAVGGNARRRVPDAAPALTHLLRRQVLRLSDHGQGRRRAAGALGVRPAARSPISGLRATGTTRPTPSRSGSRRDSGGGSTTRSSARTRRRCGAFPGSQIRSLWAAQRIKNFSLGRAILTILGFGQGQRHDADRGVPLPAPRAGPDVGGLRGRRGGQVDPRLPQAAMHCDQAFGQSRDQHRRPAERRHR